MSTAALPALQPTFSRTPSYSAEPGLYEQRLALNARSLPHPTGNFIKSSKNGNAKLRLTAQESNIDLPVYGTGGVVEGTIELTKTENISTVEITVEGGGHTETTLCLDTVLLWIKDGNNPVCPPALPFSLTLPTTFQYNGRSYPLPPSHTIKLKGLPGFYATIDYSVSAVINKPNSVPNIVPLVKSKKLGINIGSTTLSTPFIYYPRTRPAAPIPVPLQRIEGGFIESPEWRKYESVLKASPKAGAQDIYCKVYVPASRIFCASQAIPFHVTFESTAYSLAAFLPYGPTTSNSGKMRPTRIQLMRQSTVDVRGGYFYEKFEKNRYMACRLYRGRDVQARRRRRNMDVILGIPGLSVMDVTKSPFVGIREVIPARLTTDAYTEDGRGITARQSFSVPPSPEEETTDNFAHAM
ncbi:hypothetical protein MSAN_01471700 [Mycena sanguinolenta]|uniref:Uncharacterized protein n=1 Tax=Mycena sanguinolenta TaxID=230812 RepID=A0A8H6YB85_9AGAR|nr:hypothetical protein MSAN_01471700 [Mycena sanguinolenta]